MPVMKDVMLHVRTTKQLKVACDKAARAAGLAPADWIRAVLARAVSEHWLALNPRPKGKGAGGSKDATS